MSRRSWISAAMGLALGTAIWIWKAARRDRLDLASEDVRHTWKPVVNLPWVNYGFDFGGAHGAVTQTQLDSWFRQLGQDGIKAITWFLFTDGRGSLKFDSSGYVDALAPGFRADYQTVLKAARRHGLQIIWVLTDFLIGMPAENAGTTRMFGHPDLIEEPAKRASFVQNALAPVLQDRENSDHIAGWIVMNEPEFLLRSGRVTEAALREFTQEVAAAIKSHRPGERVGVANSDLTGMMVLADLAPLDFLVFHHYRPYLPPSAGFVREYLQNRLKIAKARPIFIGEFNLNSPPGMALDRFVQTSANLGYAGVWPWSLRDRINDSGTGTTEIQPQFAEVRSYSKIVQEQESSPHDVGMPLSEIEQRIAALQGEPELHQAEAKTNLEWAKRCSAALSEKKSMGDSQRFRAALVKATERSRMHAYLHRETTLELDWLQALKQLK